MKRLKIVLRLLWVWLCILWRKYILRRKPARPLSESGKTATQEVMSVFGSIAKLLHPVQGPPLMELDLDRPAVYMTRTLYETFEDDFENFISNIYLYARWQSHYVRGLSEMREGDEPVWLPLLDGSAYLTIVIAVDDEGNAIYKIGKYRQGEMEMKVFEPDKHPVADLQERARALQETIERGANTSGPAT